MWEDILRIWQETRRADETARLNLEETDHEEGLEGERGTRINIGCKKYLWGQGGCQIVYLQGVISYGLSGLATHFETGLKHSCHAALNPSQVASPLIPTALWQIRWLDALHFFPLHRPLLSDPSGTVNVEAKHLHQSLIIETSGFALEHELRGRVSHELGLFSVRIAVAQNRFLAASNKGND